MSGSKKNLSQDDSDVDIYQDFDEFNIEDELIKLEGSKEIYKQEAFDLSEKVKKLTDENQELKNSNEVLKKNLSVLLKTAKAEVQRKDSIISELRIKVDSFAFRRSSKPTKDKYTETEESELSVVLNCKCMTEKKRSKSHESKSSSDTCKYFQEDDKKKEFTGTKENLACETNKWMDHYRGKKSSNSFESNYKACCHERLKDNSFYRCRERNYVDPKRSFRHNFRDHLKYDSLDKKRRSDEYYYSARYSRERREGRREGSTDRQRKKDFRKKQSCSKEHYSEYKDAFLNQIKSKPSVELISRKKEEVNDKIESLKKINVLNEIGKTDKTSENKKTSNLGKINIRDEKNPLKSEKKEDCKAFNTISPLEGLYSESVRSQNSSRSSNSGILPLKSETDEGACSMNKFSDEEDSALSFQNERKNEARSMTLFSKRMLKKLVMKSVEVEKPQSYEKAETKSSGKVENKSVNVEVLPKNMELEKEPGELTDDENIVESSKEFQELTKVASIEIKNNNTPEKKEENINSEKSLEKKKEGQLELNKDCGKNLTNKQESKGKEHKEVEISAATNEVIEFSPFKKNYKLIEISPIKPCGSERLLDYFSEKIAQPEKDSEPYILSLISPLSNTKEPNDSKEKTESDESILKPDDCDEGKEVGEKKIDSNIPTPLKNLIKVLGKEEKIIEKRPEKNHCDSNKEQEKENEKFLNDIDKKETMEEPPRNKLEGGKKNGKPKQEKTHKRKRLESECSEEVAHKKQKTKEIECDEVSTKLQEKLEPENSSNEQDKVKEDISFFEFFKPIANKEKEELCVSSSADYKMTTTMSLTGVVCLETPNKRVEKLKNLMINEQMVYSVNVDSKTAPFSPLMTPRRMLKNDLMLTDSEDDSAVKTNEEDEEQQFDDSFSESSCDSDSGASDFVDLL